MGNVLHYRCAACDRAFRTWTRSFWLVELGLLALLAAFVSGVAQSHPSYPALALAGVAALLAVVMAKRWKTARDNPIRQR